MELETWIKSSFCEASGCVWVATDGLGVHVSEGKETLTFTREEWADFLAGVKAGEFDLA